MSIKRKCLAAASTLVALAAVAAGTQSAGAAVTYKTAYPVVSDTVTQDKPATVSYVKGGVLHRSWTAPKRLQGVGEAYELVTLADNRSAVLNTSKVLTVHAADGSVVRRIYRVEHIMAGFGGSRLAYVARTSSDRLVVVVLDRSGNKVRSAYLPTVVRNAALVSFRGWEVLVSSTDKGAGTYRLGVDGVMRRWSSYVATAGSDQLRRAVLRLSYSTDTGRHCWAMVDSTGAPKILYTRCGTFHPRNFSADEGSLVGEDIVSGRHYSTWSIRDVQTGDVVLKVTPQVEPGAYIYDVRVHNPGIDLVANIATAKKTNALVKCTWGGTCTTETKPVALSDTSMYLPIVLARN